jgi:hypothetical protein
VAAKIVVQSLYTLTGLLFLITGTAVLLLGTGRLPAAARDLILEIGGGNPNALHVMQELASALVCLGMIALWFARH